eukprot:2839814-Rhodomonas_salina.3
MVPPACAPNEMAPLEASAPWLAAGASAPLYRCTASIYGYTASNYGSTTSDYGSTASDYGRYVLAVLWLHCLCLWPQLHPTVASICATASICGCTICIYTGTASIYASTACLHYRLR